jgi:hypothetical protein
LRDGLSRQEKDHAWNEQVNAARAEVINLVNNFFHEKLTAVPTIHNYLLELQQDGGQ